MAGFYDVIYDQRNFTSITGVYLSLSFLPFTMNNVASQIAATASSFVGALG
jgi:hypothetical protein